MNSTPTNSRWSAYLQLLLARLRELIREPEVVFWVFGFPILLALGLGIAFRNKPADVTSIAIVDNPQAQNTLSMLQNSPQHDSFHATVLPHDAALNGFRLGKYDLVIETSSDSNLEYQFDPARPESVLSRALVNDALQDSAGRKDPLTTKAVVSSE